MAGDRCDVSEVRCHADMPDRSQRPPAAAHEPRGGGRMRDMIDSPQPRPRPDAHGLSRSALPFRLLALVWVITGGLVAAVTSPLGLEHGSWSAAFQVLVGGVLQAGLGIAQQALASRGPSRRVLIAELLTWNLGALAVIAGTLLTTPLLVDAGGLLLVATMVLMIRAVGRRSKGPAWALWTYRAVLLVTLVSIPIGVVLAHLRAG